MPPLSLCLSGSPCKTETDEAAGTCSPVHWGIRTHIQTTTHCLYPLSHVGLISTKPVRAGCLSKTRRGIITSWLNMQTQKTIHTQTLIKTIKIHLFNVLVYLYLAVFMFNIIRYKDTKKHLL